MGFFSHYVALDLHKAEQDGQQAIESFGNAANKLVTESIALGRMQAADRLRAGERRKQDACTVLLWHAERWKDAGRPDHAKQYRAMEKRVRKGAPFTVHVDPETQEVSIALV
jgi:hypothetical protein